MSPLDVIKASEETTTVIVVVSAHDACGEAMPCEKAGPVLRNWLAQLECLIAGGVWSEWPSITPHQWTARSLRDRPTQLASTYG